MASYKTVVCELRSHELVVALSVSHKLEVTGSIMVESEVIGSCEKVICELVVVGSHEPVVTGSLVAVSRRSTMVRSCELVRPLAVSCESECSMITSLEYSLGEELDSVVASMAD